MPVRIFLHDKDGRFLGYQAGIEESEHKNYRRRKIDYALTNVENPDEDYYVPNPEAPYDERVVEKRPKLAIKANKKGIVADGVDEVKFVGLPDPVTVLIDEEPHLVVGGELEFSANIKGMYEIVIDQWPFMPWRMVVRAR